MDDSLGDAWSWDRLWGPWHIVPIGSTIREGFTPASHALCHGRISRSVHVGGQPVRKHSCGVLQQAATGYVCHALNQSSFCHSRHALTYIRVGVDKLSPTVVPWSRSVESTSIPPSRIFRTSEISFGMHTTRRQPKHVAFHHHILSSRSAWPCFTTAVARPAASSSPSLDFPSIFVVLPVTEAHPGSLQALAAPSTNVAEVSTSSSRHAKQPKSRNGSAPCSTRSFMFVAIILIPAVSCSSIANVISNFVPSPSSSCTNIGTLLYPAACLSMTLSRPSNPALAPVRPVVATASLLRLMSSLPTSMDTPHQVCTMPGIMFVGGCTRARTQVRTWGLVLVLVVQRDNIRVANVAYDLTATDLVIVPNQRICLWVMIEDNLTYSLSTALQVIITVTQDLLLTLSRRQLQDSII